MAYRPPAGPGGPGCVRGPARPLPLAFAAGLGEQRFDVLQLGNQLLFRALRWRLHGGGAGGEAGAVGLPAACLAQALGVPALSEPVQGAVVMVVVARCRGAP